MKKRSYLIILLFIIIIPTISLTISKRNTITIQANTYMTPANNAFDDDNFYKCVVDSYNSKNNTNLSYDTNLSDEQLKTIIKLECQAYSKGKIKSAKGLNKLSNLKELYISFNELKDIDLSNNTSLEILQVAFNKLTNLDLSTNTNLKDLIADYNNINNINVKNNTILEKISLPKNKLHSIDLSKNANLELLCLDRNELVNIDLTKNINLKYLYLNSNKLTSVDLSNNTNLEYAFLENNNISLIKISGNSNERWDLYKDYNAKVNIDDSNIYITDLSSDIDYNTFHMIRDYYIDYTEENIEFLKYMTDITNINVSNNVSNISLCENYNPDELFCLDNNIINNSNLYINDVLFLKKGEPANEEWGNKILQLIKDNCKENEECILNDSGRRIGYFEKFDELDSYWYVILDKLKVGPNTLKFAFLDKNGNETNNSVVYTINRAPASTDSQSSKGNYNCVGKECDIIDTNADTGNLSIIFIIILSLISFITIFSIYKKYSRN